MNDSKGKELICSNAFRYKAIRYPTCNNGKPCQACLTKWREAQQVRAYLRTQGYDQNFWR